MRFFLLLFCVVLTLGLGWAGPGGAQDSAEDDQSFLERWLQDTLSGAGRDITITGFSGALSSSARMQELTIADDEGVWLTVRDVQLDWSRLALLRGRLQVSELSVGYVDMARAPVSEQTVTPEDAEAGEFALPELPVSVNIDRVYAERIQLGEALAGQPVALTLDGSVMLDGGAARADLAIRELERSDQLTLGAGFSNETRILAIDLALSESAGGILTALAGIPGAPQINLTIQGEAPISDFEAAIALSSNGQERLGGSVQIGLAEGTTDSYRFGAMLEGDLQPLLQPDMHPFFGNAAALDVQGQTRAGGGVDLERLSVSTAALRLDGSLSIDGSGWPERFDLSGEIAGDGPMRLPSDEARPVMVSRVALTARHDGSQGPGWEAEFEVEGFDNGAFQIGSAALSGRGTMSRDGGKAIDAAVELAVNALTAADPALNTALGETITGTTGIGWQQGQPIAVRDLDVTSGDARLTATAEIGAVADGLPVSGDATLAADDLTRFADLAGRDLAGAADLALSGRGTLLTGAFDLVLDAGTSDLRIGEARLDPLLAGESTLRLDAERDTEGTRIDTFTLRNAQFSSNVTGQLNATTGALSVAARLNDVSLAEPRLAGPVTLSSEVEWTAGSPVQLTNLDLEGAGAVLTGDGTLDPDKDGMPVTGSFTLQSSDLSRLADLAGRDVAGQINATFEGAAEIRGETFDLKLQARATDLRAGIAQLDPLLAGTGTLSVSATRNGDAFALRTLDLAFPKLTASGDGQVGTDGGSASLQARVTDLDGVSPGLSGPARLDAEGTWDKDGKVSLTRLDASAAGASINAEGAVWPDEADLPVEGKLTLNVADFRSFASLAGLPSLAGSLALEASGQGKLKTVEADATVNLEASGFRTGLTQVDALAGGDVSLSASAAIGDGPPDIRKVDLTTRALTVKIGGTGPGTPVTLDARLSDLGLLVPGFPGPLTMTGEATFRDAEGRDVDLNITANGPGGIEARVNGNVEDFGQTVALGITGSAPAGIANQAIEPRSIEGRLAFDLRVDGAPGLDAASGTVRLSDARLSLPNLKATLSGISGGVDLANRTAQVTLGGVSATGGRFDVSGPITLAAPFSTNLSVVLQNLGLLDPSLYSTSLTGQVNIDGPLAGGALIAGTIGLGKTELRIPSGSVGIGAIPDIEHRGESPAVYETLRRAGLIKEETESGGGAPLGLDLTINAPNQIFIRGRGLDAEMGGSIQLQGTTAAVIGSGSFELIRGRLDILGKRLDLTEGLIDLRGSLDPYLRVVAENETDDVIAKVIIEGQASSPEVKFESTPPLPQEEVAARLLFGQDISKISAFQAAQLVSAAATLSGRGGGGLLGGLRSGLGLSDLDVKSTDDGGTEVRAGAYLSENIYSEIAVDSDGNEEININLDVSPSLTVKGIAGSDGNTGFGIYFERDY